MRAWVCLYLTSNGYDLIDTPRVGGDGGESKGERQLRTDIGEEEDREGLVLPSNALRTEALGGMIALSAYIP